MPGPLKQLCGGSPVAQEQPLFTLPSQSSSFAEPPPVSLQFSMVGKSSPPHAPGTNPVPAGEPHAPFWHTCVPPRHSPFGSPSWQETPAFRSACEQIELDGPS